MNDFYPLPDEKLKRRRLIEYRDRFIKPLFPKDKSARIVDLGCGYGLFLDSCQQSGYQNCTGVESIEKCATYARQTFNLKEIVQADLFDYLESIGDNDCDVITALNVVEHIKKDEIPRLLELINKKLKPGGLFIMEVPNADSPLGIHTFFSDLTHEFAFSRKLATRLLKLAGFDNIKIIYQPNQRRWPIRIAQQVLAKIVGFEADMMFSANIILAGYKK